uniref:Rab-GAP TBC domain-containing protein n=1 Tax=Bursaphelenchus xylophilus TaxID=6326 RepID=A0A1I7SM47_BURXY
MTEVGEAFRTELNANNHNDIKNQKSSIGPAGDSEKPRQSVHFEWDEDEKPGRVGFVRASNASQSSGLFSRLSIVVRRSLRLGPKQRSTAIPGTKVSRPSTIDDKQTFTSYTDLRKQPCDIPYGSIAELQYMLQMNRKQQCNFPFRASPGQRVFSNCDRILPTGHSQLLFVSDGQAFFRLSTEYKADVNRLDEHELASVSPGNDSKEVNCQFKRSLKRLSRQPFSLQSNDSAFVDDVAIHSSKNSSTEDIFDDHFVTMSGLTISESFDEQPTSFEGSQDSERSVPDVRNKLRSASIDSGYLESSPSSSHPHSEEDHLTVVDEDEPQDSDSRSLSISESLLAITDKDLIVRVARLFNCESFLQQPTLRNARKLLENVKKFVRHNDWPVTHEIRSDLWRVLCNYKDFETNKALYQQQLNELMKSGVKTIQPSFLSMDGIVVDDHSLKQLGSVALQRVLIVVECIRPELRYVPILYPLCAILLHYMSAEETFSTVIRFLGTGSNFLIQSDVSLFASQHTLLALLKKHRVSFQSCSFCFHKESTSMRRAGTNEDFKLAEVFQPWSAWIFKHLPFDYLVRVVDCFLVEGHKMLLRVALSLVYLWYKQRVRSAATASGGQTPEDRVQEIAEQISILAQNCPVSSQTLLDMGFAIRNFKHSTFEHLQKHYEDKYREEVHRRRLEKPSTTRISALRNPYTAPFKSTIIDADSAQDLMAAFPSRYQLETPLLLFRLSEHGASFTQLWAQIDEAEQSLLIIRTTTGEIFGAYCSACWAERRDVRERARTRYFGTGESFVFKQPKDQLFPTIYPWVGRNHEQPDQCPQMFMTAGDKFLIIGSGGGDAIAIRDELTHGLSYPCETFGSAALVNNTSFDIDELEVFNVVSAGAV